ncbi:DNA polymerase III subunit gamma/tau domain-containing protein [Bounagaea algeriensis]
MNRDSGAEQPTQRTVAELLAEYGNSPDSGDGGERGSSRRRRRRAEDPTETAPQAIIDRVLSDSGKMRPIDPNQDEPPRRGHRARADAESDAEGAPAQAEANAPEQESTARGPSDPGTPARSSSAQESAAQESAAQESAAPGFAASGVEPGSAAPHASAEGGQAAQAHSSAGGADEARSGSQEQAGRGGKQSGKSGKANYWARRLSMGRKSQARQEPASAPAESNADTNRMITPVAQSADGTAQPEGQRAAADAYAEQGGAYPQQVGEVGPGSGAPEAGAPETSAPETGTPEAGDPEAGDPEATAQQSVPPAASPAPQAPASQPPAAPSGAAPSGAAAGSNAASAAAPDAAPHVAEGATEQFPPVAQAQPSEGGAAVPPERGTAVLPPPAGGAVRPAGQNTAGQNAAGQNAAGQAAAYGTEAEAYADEAVYLGEATGADGVSYHEDDPRSAGYDNYADYAEYSDYDDLDEEYDPELPAGMAAQDYADDEEGAEPASGRREWLTFAGQAVVGLLLGGLVWVGFRWLWLAFAPAALVAALVVTGCLVLVARKVLRTDDLQSILLAVLVGLVCTVSPAALLLISL